MMQEEGWRRVVGPRDGKNLRESSYLQLDGGRHAPGGSREQVPEECLVSVKCIFKRSSVRQKTKLESSVVRLETGLFCNLQF